MEWHDRIRGELKRLGWTKAELARRSGVSYDSVNKYLRGDINQPRVGVLPKIADALGVSAHWLQFGVDLPSNGSATVLRRGAAYTAPLVDAGAIVDKPIAQAWDGESVVPLPFEPSPDLSFFQIIDRRNTGKFSPGDYVGFRDGIEPEPGEWAVVAVPGYPTVLVGKLALLEVTPDGGRQVALTFADEAHGRLVLGPVDEYRVLGRVTHHIASL